MVVDVAVVILGCVLGLIFYRLAPKLKNRVVNQRHDENQAVLFPNLNLFDSIKEVFGNKHSILSYFNFHYLPPGNGIPVSQKVFVYV